VSDCEDCSLRLSLACYEDHESALIGVPVGQKFADHSQLLGRSRDVETASVRLQCVADL